MQRLEEAIAKGNHKEASVLAKEVTKLQISTKLSLKELKTKRTPVYVQSQNKFGPHHTNIIMLITISMSL